MAECMFLFNRNSPDTCTAIINRDQSQQVIIFKSEHKLVIQ